MRKFYESTTAQFGIMILSVAALAVGFSDLTWVQWLDAAKWIMGFFASKEGIRYGAEAYSNNE